MERDTLPVPLLPPVNCVCAGGGGLSFFLGGGSLGSENNA